MIYTFLALFQYLTNCIVIFKIINKLIINNNFKFNNNFKNYITIKKSPKKNYT
jgi:hypothetical protein